MSDSDIITRCPQCNTAFRVTRHQISTADGAVRCGACLAVFTAIDCAAGVKFRKAIDAVPDTAAGVVRGSKKHSGQQTLAHRQKKITETLSDREAADEGIINDDLDESGEPTGDNSLAVDTGNSKNTGIPERKFKSITGDAGSNPDESRALDMLVVLEHDKAVQTPRIERKPEKKVLEKPQETKTQSRAVSGPRPGSLPTGKISSKSVAVVPAVTQPKVHKDNPGLKADTDSAATVDQPVLISEAEIDNAVQKPAHYAGDSSDYLSRIEPVPVEMEWFESASTRRWLWRAGALLAVLVMVAQIAVYRFDSLSLSPGYRPFYQGICAWLDCTLPDLVDTGKVRTTNLLVRSHPALDKALVLDAILVNTAGFEQPFPGLYLQFRDLNNQLVAARVMQPDDYLSGELAGARFMPANQPVQISIGIIDPGSEAVNYQLSVVEAGAN